MNKIILARASESSSLQGRIRQFRADLGGHAKILRPGRNGASNGSASQWLQEHAEKADFVVVFYAATETGRITPAESPAPGPTTVATGATADAEPSNAAGSDVTTVSVSQLAQLPGDATVLVAVPDRSDRDLLPNSLKHYRCFDLSSDDAREAFLCTLVHQPVTPKRSMPTQDAFGAVGKVVLGHVASVFGSFDRVRDFLLANLNEHLAVGLHYCMLAIVIALLFTGYLALLRLAIDSLSSVLHIDFRMTAGPGRWALWRQAVVGVGALAIVVFSLQFLPKPLNIDTVVTQHLGEWARRLEDSQVENGGIREHPLQGVGQVWVTAQGLAGLLSGTPVTKLSVTDVDRAFAFVERTRITNVALKPGAREDLSATLASHGAPADFSRLPQTFSTLALALGAIARVAGPSPLPAAAIQALEQNPDRYFTFGDPPEGWGYFEQFDFGLTDIAAWVAVAKVQSLRADALSSWPAARRAAVKQQTRDIIRLLGKREISGQGGYSPVSDTSDPGFSRTYSTVMALWAMTEAAAPDLDILTGEERAEVHKKIRRILDWLEKTAQPNGWRMNPANPTDEKPFLGVTAQTLFVAGRVTPDMDQKGRTRFSNITQWLLQSSDTWTKKPMNENDRLHDSDRYLYPTQRVIEGSTFLWYPWAVALFRSLAVDPALTDAERRNASKVRKNLRARVGEYGRLVTGSGAAAGRGEYNYVAAEGLVGFQWLADRGKASAR